jgi:hypothetical protein
MLMRQVCPEFRRRGGANVSDQTTAIRDQGPQFTLPQKDTNDANDANDAKDTKDTNDAKDVKDEEARIRRCGPVNPVSLRSLRSFAAKTSELEPMNLPQRYAESTKINSAAVSGQQGHAARNTELAESPCGFDLEGVVGERVMPQECPEMGGKAKG